MPRKIEIKGKGTTLLIVRETTQESIISDVTTFVMLVVLCSYGVWLGSFMIELIGGIIFGIYLLGKTIGQKNIVTTEQAITTLREWQEETK